ncbi:hypothetical protein CRD36_10115 [Paremcibacter congregatus]|uniref:Uncharacterized protein n=1 Tax=Paremcibacter congregatus TaxID=2043170 RepID=A0A2G4YTK6_9PROT|nr:hypothetical protein CRD36_10115 [Paremcibacter congregatus]
MNLGYQNNNTDQCYSLHYVNSLITFLFDNYSSDALTITAAKHVDVAITLVVSPYLYFLFPISYFLIFSE